MGSTSERIALAAQTGADREPPDGPVARAVDRADHDPDLDATALAQRTPRCVKRTPDELRLEPDAAALSEAGRGGLQAEPASALDRHAAAGGDAAGLVRAADAHADSPAAAEAL
jgi:hypothetical protein